MPSQICHQFLIHCFIFQCNRCKPLYNKKQFRRGDQDNSYPCVKCECNEHAISCIYNQSLDSSPDSRTQGGGGVCIDCRHNTTGRYCGVCKERFYREPGKSLNSSDVCSPCGCEGPGVQSGKLDCVKVSAILLLGRVGKVSSLLPHAKWKVLQLQVQVFTVEL